MCMWCMHMYMVMCKVIMCEEPEVNVDDCFCYCQPAFWDKVSSLKLEFSIGSGWLESTFFPPSTGVIDMYHCACCFALVLGMQIQFFMLVCWYFTHWTLTWAPWSDRLICIILKFILLFLIYNWGHWGTVINRIRQW